jgi:5-methylcytosine-specific restriction endonuclease McrA
MPKNPYAIKIPTIDELMKNKKSNKKRQLTNAQKIYCWENNPHTCNICLKRVTKFSDAEFDHAKAHSKGGISNLTNVKIAHRQCNRLKGTKTLAETKKLLGIKAKKKKTTKKKHKKRKSKNPSDISIPTIKLPVIKI